MNVNVDSGRASQILKDATLAAQDRAYRVPRDMETKIEQIIGHTHLTYKYVLLTGMLAKATNPRANPLVLQAGAPLQGAFDARSLCHGVVVPFEQTVLEKRLGGSNEPFLNKPARYTHLSMDNAVRRGKDRATLQRLIEVFEMVNEQENGDQALVAVLSHVLAMKSRVVVFDTDRFGTFVSKAKLLALVEALLAKSCEGETLALSVALLFELMAKGHGNDLIVSSHPANQSGASSNEVADIDVFEADGQTLRHCVEAKDKPFTRADVDHAGGKVAEAGHSAMIFVYGPNAKTELVLPAVVAEYEAKGFDLTFVAVSAFADGIVSLAPSVTWAEVVDLINKHLALMRAKETTIQHCTAVLESF
ncbi:restriction endonuclease, SacI family [Loktanella sp. SALINAS62]|nr:restriction endonuclease, SacI family [Loktanella sp. SALINAS62]MBS1301694.1 restriction endonuclease, SacI family [Loktanella sp. SALINAS62]